MQPPADGRTAGAGWSRRDLEIIARRVMGQPQPERDRGAAPPAAPPHAEIRIRERRDRPAPQVVASAIFGLAFLGYLVGALTATGRDGSSAPSVTARPSAPDARPPSATVRTDAHAPPSSVAPTRPEPSGGVVDLYVGEAVVRNFYAALGRGDGERASALVVAEKRSSRAFSPQAMSRFYGGLREPIRLTAVTPLARDAYRVAYRYSAGRSRCDGKAVVTLTSRDGRDLIRSIRALDGC